jgi:diadenosine tetraphosphate (Ap4A) HIT family hydrolase
MPQLSKALKSGMVATGVNIFIANGWVAGQQFPHVLVHMFPRENGDGFFNYLFDKRNSKLDDARTKVFQNIFPQMMTNHFGRHPASWHVGKGDIPAHLTGIYESNTVVYEDEKVLCVLPENAIVDGHLEIYSKTEEKYLENLSIDDSAHLFFTASLATTLAFENLGLGQNSGTNIIVKSGESDDNPGGKLVVHILPRVENDTLKNLAWQPSQPKYNLDDVQKKLKDKTWTIKYSEEEAPKQEPQTIPESPKTILSNEDEIKDAIMRLHE